MFTNVDVMGGHGRWRLGAGGERERGETTSLLSRPNSGIEIENGERSHGFVLCLPCLPRLDVERS